MYTFTIHPTETDRIATDLKEIAAAQEEAGHSVEAFRIHIDGQGSIATGLYVPAEGRIGLAWGAYGDWADYDDIEEAVNDWLNDNEAYTLRN